jgi:hypothetical protein
MNEHLSLAASSLLARLEQWVKQIALSTPKTGWAYCAPTLRDIAGDVRNVITSLAVDGKAPIGQRITDDFSALCKQATALDRLCSSARAHGGGDDAWCEEVEDALRLTRTIWRVLVDSVAYAMGQAQVAPPVETVSGPAAAGASAKPADDERPPHLFRPILLRSALWLVGFAGLECALGLCVWYWGDGANLLQKITNSWVLFLAVFAFCAFLYPFVLGRERWRRLQFWRGNDK